MDVPPVVALLSRQPAARLREMQAELRNTIDSLTLEHELVGRALAVKAQGKDAGEVLRARPTYPPERRGKRELFREILAQRPNHDWTPTEILTDLQRRGLPSTGAAVRVMMRRMADSGETVRTPLGWRLASEGNSAEDGAADGLSENGSEPLLFAAPNQETDLTSS